MVATCCCAAVGEHEYRPDHAVDVNAPEWLETFCSVNNLLCFSASADPKQWVICRYTSRPSDHPLIYVEKTLSREAFMEIHARHLV